MAVVDAEPRQAGMETHSAEAGSDLEAAEGAVARLEATEGVVTAAMSAEASRAAAAAAAGSGVGV